MKPPKHPPEEKMKVIIESLRQEKSLSQICRENGISMAQYYKWKDKFIKGGLSALSGQTTLKQSENATKDEIKQLKHIIGELSIENQILKKTQEILKQI